MAHPPECSQRSYDIRHRPRIRDALRLLRAITVAAILAAVLVGVGLFANAWRQSGCGQGREELLAALAPLGDAPLTFMQRKLKDMCWAYYSTTASPARITAHHEAQLASRGWRMRLRRLRVGPRSLKARRGDRAVTIVVADTQAGHRLVTLHAYIVPEPQERGTADDGGGRGKTFSRVATASCLRRAGATFDEADPIAANASGGAYLVKLNGKSVNIAFGRDADEAREILSRYATDRAVPAPVGFENQGNVVLAWNDEPDGKVYTVRACIATED